MTEFTVVVLRFGLFIAMWFFVFMVVTVLGRDLFGARAGKMSRRARKHARKNGAEVAPTPADDPTSDYDQPNPHPTELLVTAGPLSGTVIGLGTAPITLGRSRDNTLVLDDDFASGFHAKIAPDGNGGWYVEDLGSTNGTYLGQNKLTAPTSLHTDMPVTVGNTTVELRS